MPPGHARDSTYVSIGLFWRHWLLQLARNDARGLLDAIALTRLLASTDEHWSVEALRLTKTSVGAHLRRSGTWRRLPLVSPGARRRFEPLPASGTQLRGVVHAAVLRSGTQALDVGARKPDLECAASVHPGLRLLAGSSECYRHPPRGLSQLGLCTRRYG